MNNPFPIVGTCASIQATVQEFQPGGMAEGILLVNIVVVGQEIPVAGVIGWDQTPSGEGCLPVFDQRVAVLEW
jgi:hypothetical protein